MAERLFPIEEIPEVPLFRPPRRSRGETDARFRNDYPPEWHRCPCCVGLGCPTCHGMGSLKALARLIAHHRCERCGHPYVPKGDAEVLGVDPSWREGGWSACDDACQHPGPIRVWLSEVEAWAEPAREVGPLHYPNHERIEAQWRILTVHHLDGDKANCRWWNLAVLDQRCHLEVQGKVVMERVYPHEHSAWFKPHAAGYYAAVYLDEPDLSPSEVAARLDELLALERAAVPA